MDARLPTVFNIPEIWCPVPARLHPDADGLDDPLLAWARGVGLFEREADAERFRRAGFGRFAASVWPDSRVEPLRLLAGWLALFWCIDDDLDECGGMVRHDDWERFGHVLLAQLTSGAPAASRFGFALDDLWRRTVELLSSAWRARFVGNFRDYLAAGIQAKSLGAGEQALGAYVRVRQLTSGCEMTFDLTDLAAGREVAACVADSGAYRAVRTAMDNVVAWTNDVYSLRKEHIPDGAPNLVTVIRRETGGSWEDALHRAVRMIDAQTRDFLCACDDLRAMRFAYPLDEAGWDAVEATLCDFAAWIAGNRAWHDWSPRYREAGESVISPRTASGS